MKIFIHSVTLVCILSVVMVLPGSSKAGCTGDIWPADIDQDCYVDFVDYSMLAHSWKKSPGSFAPPVFDPIVIGEFDLTNGDTEANDLANLLAHDATYWTKAWMETYEDPCSLNAEWQRTLSPWNKRYGTAGVGVREASGDWGASFKFDLGGYGPGGYTLRLEQCYSNASTRVASVGASYRPQAWGNVVGQIDQSGTIDISFTLEPNDISQDGEVYICIFPKGGYCGEACYVEKATLLYVSGPVLTGQMSLTNGATQADDLANLIAHDAEYWTSAWRAVYEDACDLNAEWQRTITPWNKRFGAIGSGVGFRESSGDWGASFKLSTGGFGSGNYILRLEGCYSNPSTRVGNVGASYRPQAYGNIIGEIDHGGTVEIPFTAGMGDITGDGHIYFCFFPKGGYCGETCYIRDKATLFYAGRDVPGEILDEFPMTNGSTQVDDLANLVAHQAEYYPIVPWEKDPCDANDLNTAWVRDTSPHNYRFGTEGVGVRQSSGGWGARFKLDPNGHGAGDTFILRLEGVNSNTSTRIADVVLYNQGVGSRTLETLDGEQGTVDIPFTPTILDVPADGLFEIWFNPQGGEMAYCGKMATLFYVPYAGGDLDETYFVDINDLTIFVEQWLYCNNPNDANCDDIMCEDQNELPLGRVEYPASVAPGTVIIDGNLAEWPAFDYDPDYWCVTQWVPLDKVYTGAVWNIDNMYMCLMYDPNTDVLYGAVIADEYDGVYGWSSWDGQDCIEIYIQGDPNNDDPVDPRPAYVSAQEFYVGLDANLTTTYAQWPDGIAFDANNDPGLQAVVSRTPGGGYLEEMVYEFKVTPYDSFGGFDPNYSTVQSDLFSGKKLEFDVVLGVKSTDPTAFGMLCPNVMTGKYSNSTRLATVTCE
ncbi:MAG: hypothetical protein ABIG61_00670 [Planctomycetota bacterium]